MKRILRLRALLFFSFLVGMAKFTIAQTTETITTSTASWTVPAGVTSIDIKAWGGGGGGGASRNNNIGGSGGGAGGYVSYTGLSVFPGETFTINIGAGGTAGATTNTLPPGGTGGTTTFIRNSSTLTLITANGGTGGASTGSTAGTGGSGSVDVSLTGATITAGANGSSGGSTSGAAGGTNSAVGSGAGGAAVTSNSPGSAGAAPGGGGGGGYRTANSQIGGAGGAGRVLITYTIPACSGTPTPGNTLASVNPVVSGNTTVLSLQTPSGAGVTYQWYSSSDNSNWTAIPAANADTYTATITANTYFKCVVSCAGNDGTSNSILVQTMLTYCAPTGNIDCSLNDHITNITFNTINNSSTCGAGGYTLYPTSGTQTTTVTGGSSYNLSLTSGNGTGTHGAGAWIDFNADGDFADAGEFFLISNAITRNSTTTISIPIPSSATAGFTRMRIRYAYSTTVDATMSCTMAGTYGETEDYTIKILAAPACTSTPTPGNTIADVSSVCGSGTVNLSLQNQTTGSGVTYQWQSSADNTSWSNVSGTSSTYSATVSSDTYFQCLVTCSGFTAASSAPKLIIAATPAVLSTTPATRCGTGVVTLNGTASAGTTLSWYDVATGGTPLATGNSYTTPVLSATKDYYVESSVAGPTVATGKPFPASSETTFTTTDWGIVFDVTKQVMLKSVDLYSTSAGTVDIKIMDAAMTTELFSTGNVSLSNGGTTTPNVVPLNYTIPVGTGYRMLVKAYSGVNLVRGSSGVAFPYNSSSVNVTSSEWGGTTTGTYYWFYNLKYVDQCVSARTTVTATVNNPPAFSLNGSSVSTCSGSATSAVTVTAGGSDYDTYSWSPSTGVAGDAVNGWTFSPTVTTTYNLTASQSSGSQCANTASVAVTVKPLPAAVTITPNAATVCPNVIQSLVTNGGTINGTLLNESFATSSLPSPWQTVIGAGDALGTSNTANAGGAAYEMKFTGNSQSTSLTDRLYAGPINTSGYTSLTLSWKNFLDHYSSTYAYAVAVETSSDGINWNPTTWITNPVTADQLASTQTLSINTADVGSSTFYVSFKMSGLTFGAYYWYIDDVLLTGSATSTISWSPTASLFTDAAATIPYTGNPTTVYAQTASTQTYTATATGTNGCTTSSDVTVTVSCALPVTITRFTGAKEGNKNVLRWITSSESNNNGFEIQRSTDGVQYTTIGFVQSLAIGGNSASDLNYLYADNSYTGTVQYYRLRQVDNDGRSQLSNVVTIRDNHPMALSIADVYPNPASALVNVVITAPASDKVQALITDVFGNVVASKQVMVQKGNNLVTFNIGELAAGSYFVKLICNNNCPKAVAKFVKK